MLGFAVRGSLFHSGRSRSHEQKDPNKSYRERNPERTSMMICIRKLVGGLEIGMVVVRERK